MSLLSLKDGNAERKNSKWKPSVWLPRYFGILTTSTRHNIPNNTHWFIFDAKFMNRVIASGGAMFKCLVSI